MKHILIRTIRWYHARISPLVWSSGLLGVAPSGCRFYPTCSEYCIDAIERYGTLRGFLKGLARVSRCHPFSAGGVDLA